MVVGKICVQRLGVDVRGHDDERVDASMHGFEGSSDLLAGAVGGGEEQVIPVALGRLVCAADNFREELAEEIGEEEANDLSALAAQTAAYRVWHIAELFRRGLDPGAGLLLDRSRLIEDAGNRRGRNPRQPGDLFDRSIH